MKTYQNKVEKPNALDFINDTDNLLEYFSKKNEIKKDLPFDQESKRDDDQERESEFSLSEFDDDYFSMFPIESKGYAKFFEVFSVAGRFILSGDTSYSKDEGNHTKINIKEAGVYIFRITTIHDKKEFAKKIYRTPGEKIVRFRDLSEYRVTDEVFKRNNKEPYSIIKPKEQVPKGTEVKVIQIVKHDKDPIIKVKEISTKSVYYLSVSNILRKPGDVSTSFDWMEDVNYDDKVTKEQLEIILKNREALNDRTDKTIYGSGGHGRKTLDKVKKGGYVFYGEHNKSTESINNKDEDIEIVIRKILEKELLGEGIYSSINTYDGERFTWGKGFAITGQLYEVFNELNKKEKYKQIFMNVGITITNNSIQIVNNNGEILKSDNALSELKENTQLLSFFMELAEKKDYMKDVADAQDKVFSENAGKVPSYVMDKEKNVFADNWNKSSISILGHLSHWLPGKGWKNLSYSDTKGELDKILYKFIYNTVNTNAPARKRKLDVSIYEWDTGNYKILNRLEDWGNPKKIGMKTINEKWSNNIVKLKFEKDSEGILRAINKENSEYITNEECVLINKGGDSYIVLTKNAEKLKYKKLTNEGK